MKSASGPLRVGLLGASRIALESLIPPAADGLVDLVAVAARDSERAQAFATEHGIDRASSGYQELIDDPEIEVVYNALPNNMHAPWNLAAIRAGKHVLTEKPFASNADKARLVADAAEQAGVVVFDAFHYRYHPIFDRFLDVVSSGELGDLQLVHVTMLMPAPPPEDLRWSLELAGGAMMDLGCYALHVIDTVARSLGGEARLLQAQARQRIDAPGVDERFAVAYGMPHGAAATAVCDMTAPAFELTVTATGDRGSARIMNFIKVSTDDRLVVRDATGAERVEHLGTRSSYHYQLDALTAAVRDGAPVLTDAYDGVRNLVQIDAAYRLAGLSPRPGMAR